MSDSQNVSLPPHLWEALDLMAQEMGVGREALVAQAVFTLARLNGYVIAGKASGGAGFRASSPSSSAAGVPSKTSNQRPGSASKPPRGRPEPEPEPEADPEPPPEEDQEGNPFDGQDGADEPQDEPEPEPEPEPAPPPSKGKQALTLVMAGRDPLKVTGDVFTIGRGKTCDFVIDSNRVSREHARVLREGNGFVLEDLNSSNGTFYGPNKEKVTRKPIRDGDEFTFGTEKVKFLFRK